MLTGDSIGQWISRQAELFTEGNPNDDWAANTMLAADPLRGLDGLEDCGGINPGCQLNIDCEDWAGKGFGTHFWAMKAVEGFHKKLNGESPHLG